MNSNGPRQEWLPFNPPQRTLTPQMEGELHLRQMAQYIRTSSSVSRAEAARFLAFAASNATTDRPAQPTMRRTILDMLPAETLSLILVKLSHDTLSINAAREVCRKFEKAAWPAFAKSFNHRIFHPTADSLQRLVDFSKNENAAPYLTKLYISTIKPTTYEYLGDFDPLALLPTTLSRPSGRGSPVTFPELQPTPAVNAYFESIYGEPVVLETLLRNAFKSLKWLEQICIVAGDEV